jgi:hypothetical protein
MKASKRLRVAVATAADRQAIYRLRHDVYAQELGQHPVEARGLLTDRFDVINEYLVVKRSESLVGHVSITPPGPEGYSLDRYVTRDQLPFAVDEWTHEVRLLTVRDGNRSSPAAALLFLSLLAWIGGRGGTSVVALGRREVLGTYRGVGLQTCGLEVQSGKVTYEVMTATLADLRNGRDARRAVYERALRDVEWDLPAPALA